MTSSWLFARVHMNCDIQNILISQDILNDLTVGGEVPNKFEVSENFVLDGGE